MHQKPAVKLQEGVQDGERSSNCRIVIDSCHLIPLFGRPLVGFLLVSPFLKFVLEFAVWDTGLSLLASLPHEFSSGLIDGQLVLLTNDIGRIVPHP